MLGLFFGHDCCNDVCGCDEFLLRADVVEEEGDVFRLLFLLVVLVLIIELKYCIYSAFTVIYVSEWSIVVLIFRYQSDILRLRFSVCIAEDSNDTDND